MASASDLISRIECVLDDLKFVADDMGPVFDSFTIYASFMLGNYRIFLLAVTKLGDDPIFGPFLQALQDLVCEFEKFHTLRLSFLGLADREEAESGLKDFYLGRHKKSMEEQTDQLYVTLLDPSRQSRTLTAVEIDDLLASVMKNLLLFHSVEWKLNIEIIEGLIKALGEQMLFLENLRLFASHSNTAAADSHAADQLLLAHAEAVSIKVAYLLHKCVAENDDDEGSSEDLVSDIPKLIQFIKPIDPQVYHTYTEILRRSKSRRRLFALADRDVDQEFNHAKGFLDSLMSDLLELLQLDTDGLVYSVKDTLQELYQGLGSFTIILSHQPNTFDLITEDHFFDVVCDAGILICSLYQAHIQLDRDLQDLLEAIRLILVDFGEKAGSELMFNKVPSTAPLSFVDFLLEKLTELTSCEVETNTRSCVHATLEGLVTLRSLLGKIAEAQEEQEKFRTLRVHILELVYRAEHLIDYLVVGDLSDSFSLSFDFFTKDIADIHLKFDVQKLEIKMKEIPTNLHQVPSERTPSLENVVVGYHGETESIKNRLTRGSKQLRMLTIVGMPGQGKTTLASKIYNDQSVSCHFSVRARTVVSQTVDKTRVLFDLLRQIDPDKFSGIVSDYDLVQKVWRSLKGHTYLILLDDVWDAEAWSSLKKAFPDDHTASRILLTSRHHNVASREETHELRPFNEEESMDLLQLKLFNGSGWPIEFVGIGREVAQICKGLPLTIHIIAGILSTMELEDWKKILGGLVSDIVSSTEQCKNTLELSYNHLPEHLRPCLLSLATYPEDEEVSVWRLLRLWIAEGFVRKDGKKRAEDVAEEYLKDLIGRSLLMAAKQKSIGGVKSCRIHDLLHEFCLQKAKDEGFLSFLGGDDEVLEIHVPHYLRRLCINSDPKHLTRSNKFSPYVRSLNFNYCKQQVPPNLSFMFKLCRLLRILDLEQINLGSVFPSEIGLLVQLTFLAICGSMTVIPPSIGNLSNLECLILNRLKARKMLALPDSVWKLKKLSHLRMTSEGGSFPMENLYNSPDLFELEWLSGVAIQYPCDLEALLKKFPNVRKLRWTLFKSPDMLNNHVKIVVPDFLRRLESLSMSVSSDGGVGLSEFSLPGNLKKLTLTNFPLSCRSLSTISKLPNLEVLKFIDVSFEGDTWETEEEGFSKLRFLQLSSRYLISWSASEDQFECLENLVLERCMYLKEMPSCLEYVPTLEVIEVRYCLNSVQELVGKIKEVRECNRNSELKIINVNSA